MHLEMSATPSSVNLGQSIWSSTEEGLLICEELWEEEDEGSMVDNTLKSAWTPPYLSQYFPKPFRQGHVLPNQVYMSETKGEVWSGLNVY